MELDSELITHWESLLKPLFPEGSQFEVNPRSSDFKARTSWKLRTDPARPGKISKVIVVIISAEAASDYKGKSAQRQQSDDSKLQTFIQVNIAKHDPDHNNPSTVRPPEVEWIVDSSILNS